MQHVQEPRYSKGILLVKRAIATFLFLVALAFPTSRARADVPHDVTLNVSAGGFSFASKDQLRSQPAFDIRVGYDIIGNNITDSIGIEGGISYISTQSKTDESSVNAYLFRVDAIYPFFPRKRVVPFFTVGAGAMFMERGDKMDKAPVLAYGFGLKYFVQEFLAMRVDLRHNLLFDIATRNDFQYMFGLSFLLDRDKKIRRLPLPPPPPVPVKPLPPAAALPVIDIQKPEPELPLSLPAVIAAPIAIAIEALTPPAAKAVPEPAPPAQQLANPLPEEASPETAQRQALSDEDLVASILCPVAPPPGTNPRALKQPSTTVLFDPGSSVIKKQFLPGIKKLARYVQKNPVKSVYIEGHCDSVGRPEPNMRLSKKRVDTMKKAFTKGLGGKAVKIETSAYGCRVPVDTNETDGGRLKNRRATIEVIK